MVFKKKINFKVHSVLNSISSASRKFERRVQENSHRPPTLLVGGHVTSYTRACPPYDANSYMRGTHGAGALHCRQVCRTPYHKSE